MLLDIHVPPPDRMRRRRAGPAGGGAAEPGPALVHATAGRTTPGGPLAWALSRVGDRWTLLVVAALLEGPRRFGELEAEVPGVATNVLSSRLRELERHGLIVSVPYSERPLRVEYRLTAAGNELAGALRLLAAWGAGAPGAGGPPAGADPPRHSACGTPLEVRWWCPTCAHLGEDDEEVWV